MRTDDASSSRKCTVESGDDQRRVLRKVVVILECEFDPPSGGEGAMTREIRTPMVVVKEEENEEGRIRNLALFISSRIRLPPALRSSSSSASALRTARSRTLKTLGDDFRSDQGE